MAEGKGGSWLTEKLGKMFRQETRGRTLLKKKERGGKFYMPTRGRGDRNAE